MDEPSILNKKSNTSFEDEFDYKPLANKGFFANIEERVFSLFKGKKKANKKISEQVVKKVESIPGVVPGSVRIEPYPDPVSHEYPRVQITPDPAKEKYSLPFIRKKSLPERVGFQLKFPQISKVNAVINGLALVVFAVGAYVLYSALPTRPELVLGILMVSVAGNVVVSSR